MRTLSTICTTISGTGQKNCRSPNPCNFQGEREGFLDVTLDVPNEEIINRIKMKEIKMPGTPCAEYVAMAVEDAYERLMLPSVDNEVRNELKERASNRR